MTNACNAATVLSGSCTPILVLSLLLTLGFISGYKNYLLGCWCLREGLSCGFLPVYLFDFLISPL